MDRLSELIRKNAGLTSELPDGQEKIQLVDSKVGLPDNQNKRKLSGVSVPLPKNTNEEAGHSQSIYIGLPEVIPKETLDISSGVLPNQNQSPLLSDTSKKPDNQNKGNDIEIGKRPDSTDYDSTIQIDKVENQNQSELLSGSNSKPSNQNTGRTFNWNSKKPDNQFIGNQDIDISRPEGNDSNRDVEIRKRPEYESSYITDETNLPNDVNDYDLSQGKILIPQNQNPTALGKKGDPVYKNLLGKIDDFGGFIQRAVGVDVFSMNPGQINSWIKTVTGGKGIEELSNTNLGNEAMLAYVRRIMQAPNNLVRIAFDMAFRYQLLNKAADWLLNKTLGISLDDLNKKPESRKDYVLGYEINQGVLTSTYKKLTEVFFAPGQKLPNVATLNPDGFNEEVMFTTRKRLEGFELADSFYWGLNITRYEGGNISSFLPEFPPEFSNGWWPVTTCSFSKGSLKSRNIRVPFLDFNIPATKERPSNFRMTVIDNATHSIRYWLEKYINSCFDIDTNQVLPYKNLLWNIIVYRYDCTMNTLYRKNILCLLSEFTSIFNGESAHSVDEIDLEFNVVGEIPGDGQDLVNIFDTNPNVKSDFEEETIL